MEVDDLRSLYLSELQEVCDCEALTTESMPSLAAAAGLAGLRSAMGQHAGQAMQRGQRVGAILHRHGTRPRPGVDQVAAALVRKASHIVSELFDQDLRDAALIAIVRRIAHHQIAAYGAAEIYAGALRLEIDRHGLLAALQEEKSTDRQLAGLQDEVNQLALLVSPPTY